MNAHVSILLRLLTYAYHLSLTALITAFFLSGDRTDEPDNHFQKGVEYYKKRATEADSFSARHTTIDSAIFHLQLALKHKQQSKQASAFLLKSYYFKGMYTNLSESDQKELFEQGRLFGNKVKNKYPESVPILFWYGANIGRWASTHGFLASAKQGIAGKLRDVCHDIISLDSTYQGGGGYRILAQVHYHAPYIPVFLNWPSDKKAYRLITKAMNIAPDHPTNRMLYAEILLEFDEDEKARKQLKFLRNFDPRSDNLVEDRFIKYRAEQLYTEHFD